MGITQFGLATGIVSSSRKVPVKLLTENRQQQSESWLATSISVPDWFKLKLLNGKNFDGI